MMFWYIQFIFRLRQLKFFLFFYKKDCAKLKQDKQTKTDDNICLQKL